MWGSAPKDCFVTEPNLGGCVACIVMAYIVMADVVIAYVVMACIVMAYVVMAEPTLLGLLLRCERDLGG